jgi:hypothetical protein
VQKGGLGTVGPRKWRCPEEYLSGGNDTRIMEDPCNQKGFVKRLKAIALPGTPVVKHYRSTVRRVGQVARHGRPARPHTNNPLIHIKYPNFKEAVQSIAHDLNGRAHKGRQSATVCLGNSTWSTIAERLADETLASSEPSMSNR